MPRKLAVAAQIKFRIHEDLRRKIEAEAKRHRCSLSSEATRRLKASFETPPVAQILETIDRQTTLMEDAWLRFAVTPDFLAEVDRLTTAIINQPVRNELARSFRGPRGLSSSGNFRSTRGSCGAYAQPWICPSGSRGRG